MQILKKAIKNILIPRNKWLVFTYHQASPAFDPQLNGKYIWNSLDHFEKEMIFLKENFKIIPFSEGVRKLKEGRLRGTTVSITFDDGDISLSNYIVPVLKKYQIPAVFFINTAYLSGEQKGYWFNIYNYLLNGNPDQRKLITDDIRQVYANLRNTADVDYYRQNIRRIEELARFTDDDLNFYICHDFLEKLDPGLFTIGLHGHEHQRFSMMPAEWQKQNLRLNLEILSGFNAFQKILAVPFGKPHDWNPDTVNICKSLSLEFVSSHGGYNYQDSASIKRIPADGLVINNLVSKLPVKIKPDYLL
jgi:peptidoglycan/xylan/chitin deacetylase (PgdA/CDA1 family)